MTRNNFVMDAIAIYLRNLFNLFEKYGRKFMEEQTQQPIITLCFRFQHNGKYEIRDKVLWHIFIKSDLIPEDDHPDRPQFCTDLESVLQIFNMKAITRCSRSI
jgi:hypothetical protein